MSAPTSVTDWIRYGFGDTLNATASGQMAFTIDYSAACPHPIFSKPIYLARAACSSLYEQVGEPITLMLSGGVDSQAMAYAFKRAGVPTRNITARYLGDYNEHDIDSEFYRVHDIEIEYVDFDVIRFHEEEVKDWAARYQINSPHILTHCKIASMFRDSFVVSSGCMLTHPKLGGIGGMNYSIFGLERYAKISGQEMIGYFHTHDPHLVHSYLHLNVEDPTPFDLLTTVPNIYDLKCHLYRQAGFPVIAQHRKTHGFERLKDYYDGKTPDPKTRMRYASKGSHRPYDLMFRYPLEDLARYPLAFRTIYPKLPTISWKKAP